MQRGCRRYGQSFGGSGTGGSGAINWLLQWAVLLNMAYGAVGAYSPKPVALVLPVESSSHLTVEDEGLQLLSSITGPISPVVVIGPYRSGKSFTLNQLLGVPCDQGFGVGHTRDTKTKGIWMWGEPRQRTAPDGSTSMILFVDTEGFESTGKANSYDDRIFALSTVLSSLLVYNLPETIRESDVTKLSFAVELAQGFYDKLEQSDKAGSVDPGSMLWLIQRDFLEGKTADALVKAVLAPVPNPRHDRELDALNTIRTSLAAIARNSTGFSLRQPHLDRTRLCELADDQLDQGYVAQRDKLKALVQELASPKALNGRQVTGAELAELVGRMVKVLNEQEIPNVASMIDVINRELLSKCLAQYSARLAAVELPSEEAALAAVDLEAKDEALRAFSDARIGRRRGSNAKEELAREMQRQYQIRQTENLAVSNQLCSEEENKCEAELDSAGAMRLPSLHKFESAFTRCERRFLSRCMGPAKAANQDRLHKAWARARRQFEKDYNDRLFTGLLVLSLAAIALFRFVVRVQLLEAGAWVAFLFLEIYPKLYPGNIYETRGWKVTVDLWEACIWILFGFDGAVFVWLGLLAALVLFRILYRKRYRGRAYKKQATLGDRVRDLDV